MVIRGLGATLPNHIPACRYELNSIPNQFSILFLAELHKRLSRLSFFIFGALTQKSVLGGFYGSTINYLELFWVTCFQHKFQNKAIDLRTK